MISLKDLSVKRHQKHGNELRIKSSLNSEQFRKLKKKQQLQRQKLKQKQKQQLQRKQRLRRKLLNELNKNDWKQKPQRLQKLLPSRKKRRKKKRPDRLNKKQKLRNRRRRKIRRKRRLSLFSNLLVKKETQIKKVKKEAVVEVEDLDVVTVEGIVGIEEEIEVTDVVDEVATERNPPRIKTASKK